VMPRKLLRMSGGAFPAIVLIRRRGTAGYSALLFSLDAGRLSRGTRHRILGQHGTRPFLGRQGERLVALFLDLAARLDGDPAGPRPQRPPADHPLHGLRHRGPWPAPPAPPCAGWS